MRAPRTRGQVGRLGEDLAVAELQRHGLHVLARNWRCPDGEIDIIAVEPGAGHRTVVFCEVKCRTGLGFGDPLESITYAKQRRLRRLAARWLATEGQGTDRVRIDALGVVLLPGADPVLTHVRGIGS